MVCSRVALASSVCQKPGVLGFQPASNNEQMVAEIGPVACFQRLGSFAKMGAFFLQTLLEQRAQNWDDVERRAPDGTNRRCVTSSALQPLGDKSRTHTRETTPKLPLDWAWGPL